jgi:hypothetical protein
MAKDYKVNTLYREMSEAELTALVEKHTKEFDSLYYSKNGMNVLLSSIFKPDKFLWMTEYLDAKHELWVREMMKANAAKGNEYE